MSARERLSAIRASAGSKGGKATAQKGEDFRRDRAAKGGTAVLAKYGIDYLKQYLQQPNNN